MEQLTKNQAVATSQEAVQNQNEPQLRDENRSEERRVGKECRSRCAAPRKRNKARKRIDVTLEVHERQRPGLLAPFFRFLFKQETAYELGLGIPAEPLFRSSWEVATAWSRS